MLEGRHPPRLPGPHANFPAHNPSVVIFKILKNWRGAVPLIALYLATQTFQFFLNIFNFISHTSLNMSLFIYLSIFFYLSLYLTTYLSISVYLSICLSFYISISLYLSIYFYVSDGRPLDRIRIETSNLFKCASGLYVSHPRRFSLAY